jgi:eukaryotic-like serine/threonine-protein kinase
VSRADVTPGTTVGTYDVQGSLGTTAWSETFVAAAGDAEKLFALKVLDKEDDAAWPSLEEARTKLESVPNHLVLGIADLGVDEEAGVRFVATPLSDHPSLADLVDIYALAPAEAVALVKNLAIAIAAAHHAGLPHLALKPSNVFVGPPPTYAVRVVDFGADALRRAKKVRGALAWLAPEQIDSDAPADARADVFAVALLAFFAMTGKPYWSAPITDDEKLVADIKGPRVKPSLRARALGTSMPSSLDPVLLKALGPPEERHDSPRAFAEALEAALAEPPPREEEQRSSERHVKATLKLEKFRMPTLENTAPSGMQQAAPAVQQTQKLPAARFPLHERPPLPPPAPPPRRSSPSFPDATPSSPSTSTPPPAASDPAGTTSAPIATPIEPVAMRPRRSIYIPNRVLVVLVVGVTVLTLGVTIAAFRKINATPLAAPSASIASGETASPGPPTSIVVPPLPAPEENSTPDAGETLAANESELEIVCTPACEKVMIDGKVNPQYPAPLRLAPGRHGVGVARSGYGGQFKLVFLKPAERQSISFTLGEQKKK